MTTVYISGPMTGYVNHNRDAFYAAELHLTFLGFEVVNPAKLDDLDGRTDLPHHVYLRRDIEQMLGCDAIYLLPGWKHSKGATLEHLVAEGIGLVEITDLDKTAWRTFEGEPLDEDDEPLADWERELLAAEESPVETPESAGRPEVETEELSDHPQWQHLGISNGGQVFTALMGTPPPGERAEGGFVAPGCDLPFDIDYIVDDSLPENTIRLDYDSGSIDFEASWVGDELHLTRKDDLAEVSKPREGDEFPDVGHVRRFLTLLNGGQA